MEIFDKMYLKHPESWNFYTARNAIVKTFCLKFKKHRYSICLYNLKFNYNIYSLRTHTIYNKLFSRSLLWLIQKNVKNLEDKTLTIEINVLTDIYTVDPMFPLNAIPHGSDIELKLRKDQIKFYKILSIDVPIEIVIKIMIKKNLISLFPLYQNIDVEKSMSLTSISLEHKYKLFSGRLKPIELLYDIYREFGVFDIIFNISKNVVEPPFITERFFVDNSISVIYENELIARDNENIFTKLNRAFPKPNVPVCPICLQSVIEIILINCGHGICRGCVLAQTLKNCNICRSKITSMHTIYL